MSIRARLLLAFLGVLLPYLALIAIGVGGFRALSQRLHSIEQEVTQDIEGVTDLQIAILQLLMPANDYLITGDSEEREEFERRLAQTRGALARMESFSLQDPKARQLLGAIGAQVSQIETLSREILVIPDPRTDHAAYAAAHAKMKALDRLGDEGAAVLNQLREIEHGEIRKEVERGSGVVRGAAAAALAALVLSAAAGVVLALLFSRWIGYPLQTIARASHAMAQGDLSQRVDISSGGELAETARAFNLMAERLEASHAALRRTNEELAAINSIVAALTSTLKPTQVFKVLTQRMAQAVGAERCSLNLWREGHVVPVMSQFADGHTDPGLWAKFKAMGPYRLEEVPVHAEAIRTKRPVAIEDATISPLYPADWVETFGIRAALVVPLVRQDEVIGTLNLDRTQGFYGWSQDQIDLAMTIAGQAALAVENVQLYQEAGDREREATKLFHGLTLLNRATRALHRTLEVEPMLSGALEELAGAFGASSVLVNILSATGQAERSIGHWLSEAHGRDVTFRATGGISALLRQTSQPLLLRDIAERPDIVHPAHFKHGVKSLAAFPLIGGSQQVLGTLFLYYTDPQAFPDGEVRLLATYAEQLATALENARLYEESDARRKAAEALAAVGRDLTQSLDPAVVGQRITDSIRQLLRVRFSALLRLEPESGDLVAVAVSENVASIFGPSLVWPRGTGAVGLAVKERRGNLVFPKGTGAVGLAVRERRPVGSEDILADPQITLTPELRGRVDQTFRAVLAVPLVVKDRVIGALAVGDRVGRVYQAEETRLVQAFADQAAIALENARLFDEAQQALADLRTAQEQLIKGATMRALGELASGAAHHLNNLMAIVLGRVRLMLSDSKSAPVRRPLEVIERAAVDAAEVVRRVSRFARMQPLEDWKPLDLKQLAAEVLEMTRARWEDEAQAQGIRIEATFDGHDVPPVAGNAAALREVLLNVVLNAVDALPSGGQIQLRTFCEDDWVGLAVSDTGRGMSGEVQERALEPFFTTKGPKAMGLGLSVSYGILQRHGGKLAIDSAEGRGTTVTIRLPVHASPKEGRPGIGAEPVRPATRPLRILIIDDDDEVRGVVAEMLAAQGHAVLQATGGHQGLALLEAGERMDLVLTDLGMPGMNGWDVARTIRVRRPGLPVGLLTGWGEQIDEASADRQMVAGVLAKPATPESLQEFIAGCCGASRGI